jgi:hypothetical protein
MKEIIEVTPYAIREKIKRPAHGTPLTAPSWSCLCITSAAATVTSVIRELW